MNFFDTSDPNEASAMIGAMIGFAEESVREETFSEQAENEFTENFSNDDADELEITDKQVLDFAGRNPKLFQFIVALVKSHYGNKKNNPDISVELAREEALIDESYRIMYEEDNYEDQIPQL